MNARARAIEILARVEATDGYLNVVLDHRLSEEPLNDPRDAGLVTELCYGTMRRKLALDAVLAPLSSRKLGQLEDRVLAALRVGAYQIFYSRVPRRAAVSETVEGLKQLGVARAAGFCNAILRKLSGMETPPLPQGLSPTAALALRESHPEWLVDRWVSAFGLERTAEMLGANNSPAPVVLRTNSAKTSRAELLAELRGVGLSAEPTRHSPAGVRLAEPGRVDALFGYGEGLWQVQDEAAQLVGEYAAIPEGEVVLDACAAPGGKACHLAEHHVVVACDLHANKLRKIEVEAARLGVSSRLRALAHDATRPFPPDLGPVSHVLLDAPCSGLGTLRRHPELKYRRQPGDLRRLSALQAQILDNCQRLVPPGGLLVYAVCTTEPEEGVDQIEAFLERQGSFVAEPPPGFGEAGWPGRGPYLLTLPGPEGMDGFFAARLRKRA